MQMTENSIGSMHQTQDIQHMTSGRMVQEDIVYIPLTVEENTDIGGNSEANHNASSNGA